MIKRSVKELTLSCLVIFSGILLLYCMTAALIGSGEYPVENGYDFFNYKSKYVKEGLETVSTLMLIIFTSALVVIIVGIGSLYMPKRTHNFTCNCLIIVVSICFLAYFICGKCILDKLYDEVAKNNSEMTQYYKYFTQSYVALIWCVLSVATYFICKAVVSDKEIGIHNSYINPYDKITENIKKEKIELLTQYKALLDSGALTQDEFDEKKKQLLKN